MNNSGLVWLIAGGIVAWFLYEHFSSSPVTGAPTETGADVVVAASPAIGVPLLTDHLVVRRFHRL